MKYPESRAAVKVSENNQWNIGDAVLKECGWPSEDGVRNKSYAKIEELSKILAEEDGFDYSANTLRIYRDISFLYPPASRLAAVNHAIHAEVNDPEFLRELVEDFNKRGEKLTREAVRKVMALKKQRETEESRSQQISEEDKRKQEEQEKARKAADAEQRKAKRQERKFAKEEEEAKKANDELAERRAQAEKEKARKTAEEAQKKKHEIKPSPPKPKEKEVAGDLTISITVMEFLTESIRLGQKTLAFLKDNGGFIKQSSLDNFYPTAITAQNTWAEVAKLIREQQPNQRSHLSVVGQED